MNKYKAFSFFERIFQNSWLNSSLAIFLGLYYGTLDIWGEKWQWIVEYEYFHSIAYSVLVIMTIVSVIIKAYLDHLASKYKYEERLVLNKFILVIRNIVYTKRTRFYDKASNLDKNKKSIRFFDEITHPDEQIKYIMSQSREFFEFYGVKRNQIEMTVLGSIKKKDDDSQNWKYIIQSDRQREHSDANLIMNSDSLAKKAIESGDSMFLAELEEGISQQKFFESNRSKEAKNVGSIYCKPVTIKIQEVTYKYVFSIVSYGTYLCSPTNTVEAKHIAMILNEFGDRVELELYLFAMKRHKKG
ncbi:hypothetical protein FQ082_02965 [Psychrobacter sp. ANT_H56B]|uniref:hypothetical protein n=1 Tax=Psychrobacter sp. ANT_H56B TaxID=2597353 RepID=UPI0011F34F0B|nr:hypothetical protein [Psychrobacter sp. ANT_H56B]KAA0928660.1 hypothetical protein FQ082_02965 [Psychrobacter sp. ANT_H56B]